MAYVQGVDLGSWRVRVATMEGSFRRWALRDVVEMEASVGMAAAVEAIRANEPLWGQAERVAALPLERGTVRVVRLPFTDRTTIAKALPAEIESNVPYDLEEMILATRPVDAERGSSRTRAVIARKDEVSELLQALAAAHAEPKQLVLDAEALAAYAGRGVQVVLDVGHSRTVIALCQGGELLAARLVPLGGRGLTEALAQATGWGEAEAEAAKHAAQLPESVEGEGWADVEPTDAGAHALDRGATEALVRAVDELFAEVRARLIALEDELALGIDEILLAGGTSQLAGFAGRLSAWTGVPVRSVIVPGGHPPSCALVVALARVAAGEEPATDLRVGDLAYRGHADILWNVVAWGGVATAALLLGGVLVLGLRLTQAWDQAAELDKQIAATVQEHFPTVAAERLSDSSTALAIFQGEADAVKARVTALGDVVGGEPPTLMMLKRLSDTLPRNEVAKIDVRELTLTADALSMKAETDTYESAAKIEENLKASDTFAQARKSDEKKSGDLILFNLSIPLGEAEAPAADPETAPAPAGKEG